MLRWIGLVLAVLALGFVKAPAPALACGEEECGKPACWDHSFTVRPTLSRKLTASCQRVVSARLLEAPPHTAITDVSVDFYGLHFTATPTGDAPYEREQARFELVGTEQTVEETFELWALPLSVNHAPVCDGAEATQRSSGTEPADVYLNPWCRDEDGDEFTVTGGGPGVHPQAPKEVPAGFSESNWSYQPSILAGTESTTIAATDVLGARSADAPLKVTIGPDVDRLPQCYPNGGWMPDGTFRVRMRAGAIRRFWIICDDPDGDPSVAAVTAPPTRGLLAPVVAGAPWFGEQYYDATYVPTGTESDEYGMTATGPHGTGPETRTVLSVRPEDENGGGWCGHSAGTTAPGVPGAFLISCSDDDGDAITTEVLEEPAHGTLGPAVATTGLYGVQDFTIPYVPDPGFEGLDCIKVAIDDGHGMRMELLVEMNVRVPEVETPELPELPTPPELPPVAVPSPSPSLPAATPSPGAPRAPAGAPATATPDQVRAFAEGVLGTPAVRRASVLPDVEVWTPRRLSRRTLRNDGRAPGMIVLCSAGCDVDARSRRSRSSAVVAPAQPQLLWATATKRDLRKGRRVRMRVAIERAGAHRTVKRAFRLR